jgi:MFS transporter, putative metabolite:H+ symporter
VALSVGSIPAQVPRASPATFRQALFVAVTAGLGYGFDSYAVNIYGLVLPEIKELEDLTDEALAEDLVPVGN